MSGQVSKQESDRFFAVLRVQKDNINKTDNFQIDSSHRPASTAVRASATPPGPRSPTPSTSASATAPSALHRNTTCASSTSIAFVVHSTIDQPSIRLYEVCLRRLPRAHRLTRLAWFFGNDVLRLSLSVLVSKANKMFAVKRKIAVARTPSPSRSLISPLAPRPSTTPPAPSSPFSPSPKKAPSSPAVNLSFCASSMPPTTTTSVDSSTSRTSYRARENSDGSDYAQGSRFSSLTSGTAGLVRHTASSRAMGDEPSPGVCPFVASVGSVHGVSSPPRRVVLLVWRFLDLLGVADEYQSSAFLTAQPLHHQSLFNASGRGYPDVKVQGGDVQIFSRWGRSMVRAASRLCHIIALITDRPPLPPHHSPPKSSTPPLPGSKSTQAQLKLEANPSLSLELVRSLRFGLTGCLRPVAVDALLSFSSRSPPRAAPSSFPPFSYSPPPPSTSLTNPSSLPSWRRRCGIPRKKAVQNVVY
ncbi:hypothetical protein R3P38DRAFT_3283536 [Favolaschia claudopus]|uniref:Uncharacterized protein n=1 Tax=Favolaschia claudopus TaxID=2862362 RepID=A0AAW0A6H7_9AGAR